MHSTAPSNAHDARTISLSYARVLLSYLREAGIDPQRLYGQEVLDRMQQHDPATRCTLAEWQAWMQRAEEALQQGDLVPALAEHFKPWHAGLLGFMLMTSGSVQEVGRMLVRFHHLLNDVYAVARDVEGGRFFLRLVPVTAEVSPRLARMMLTGWAVRLRGLTGRCDLRLDVDFRGPPPADVAPYRRIFGGTVRFGCEEDIFWGDMAYASLPVVSRDPMIHGLLHGRAAEQVGEASSHGARLVAKIERLVRLRLEHGEATLEALAADLRLPTRTLQRRLDELGLTFRALVEQVRRTHALQLLRETRTPLLEIALALGFATPASFHRAFKRWTGTSPAAYRREHARTARPARAPAARQPAQRA